MRKIAQRVQRGRWTKIALLVVAAVVALAVMVVPSGADHDGGTATPQASGLPAGFSASEHGVIGFLPSHIEFMDDGRLLISKQDGDVRLMEANGTMRATPVASVPAAINATNGLFGTALHPNFPADPYLYVYYTTLEGDTRHGRASRITLNPATMTMVANSEFVFFTTDPISDAQVNHLGGDLQFNQDGKLYITVGDNLQPHLAPLLTSTFGKMLRFNPDGTIPTDNPFYNQTTGLHRSIWAIGLRNPWQSAVDPTDGRHVFMDVGNNDYEEVNLIAKGADFGWPNTEGPTSVPGETTPVLAYSHDSNLTVPFGNTVAGGAFYRPSVNRYPASYNGLLFFADFGKEWIGTLDVNTGDFNYFGDAKDIVDMEMGPDGYMYYATRTAWRVWKIDYNGGALTPPSITAQPTDVSIAEGENATFTSNATGSPAPTLQWLRNGAPIAGANSATLNLTNVAASDDGDVFALRATNSEGTATSSAATLTVTVNQRPTVTITSPTVGSTYVAGNSVSFGATATDPEDGTLGATSFEWEVVFHHADHTHPFIPSIPGVASGNFAIPTPGETSTDVWYRIHARATDSQGLVGEAFVDVSPEIVDLTIVTSPAGLQVRLDGQVVQTPVNTTTVAGVDRSIDAGDPQTDGGSTEYEFTGWAHGGPAFQTVNPVTDTTLVAQFSPVDDVAPQGCFDVAAAHAGPHGAANPPVGYWLVELDGNVYSFGDADWRGNAPLPGGVVAVDIVASPGVCGYWIVLSDGQILPYGDAADLGNISTLVFEAGETIVSASATPSGAGMWIFTDLGRVLTIGDATLHSGVGGQPDLRWLALNSPIVDSVATPSGLGYIMLAGDGGVFVFGDGVYEGSIPGLNIGALNGAAVGLVPDPDGNGYWVVTEDGGVFAFAAAFNGSVPGVLAPGVALNELIIGMVAYGNGYVQVAGDGGVFVFSDQPFAGSLGTTPPNTPIVAIAPIG